MRRLCSGTGRVGASGWSGRRPSRRVDVEHRPRHHRAQVPRQRGGAGAQVGHRGAQRGDLRAQLGDEGLVGGRALGVGWPEMRSSSRSSGASTVGSRRRAQLRSGPFRRRAHAPASSLAARSRPPTGAADAIQLVVPDHMCPNTNRDRSNLGVIGQRTATLSAWPAAAASVPGRARRGPGPGGPGRAGRTSCCASWSPSTATCPGWPRRTPTSTAVVRLVAHRTGAAVPGARAGACEVLAAAPADAAERLAAAIGATPLAPVLAAAAQNRRPMSLPGLGAEPRHGRAWRPDPGRSTTWSRRTW